MSQEEFLEQLNLEIKADKTYAQILIKIDNDSESFEEAKKIIEDLGTHIIETKYLPLNWILIKLDVKDMRDIALKLTEHSFFIKGINALPSLN